MTQIYLILVLFSGISFMIYGSMLFLSNNMKNEFKRFQLEKLITLIGVLEILGGFGQLIGLKFNIILLISSGGLALLMLLGCGVRLKIKDGFWKTLPALFFMLLNIYIFIGALYLN